jgi:3-isopropylmalate/(R)-2-methylmalate dehydratase small subunit
MQAIKTLRSRTVVMPSSNIDTDQIIPARFLTTTTKEGLGQQLFADWRYDAEGKPRADFILNRPEAAGCRILVAGRNIGCGSSREHAPFAMHVAGCKAVIASTYARIFYRNAVDGGFVVPFESFDDVSHEFRTYDEIEIDTELNIVRNLTTGVSFPIRPLGDVADIVEAGGIFAYARKHNMF